MKKHLVLPALLGMFTLSHSQAALVDSDLFAVLGIGAVAQNLAYGPSALTPASSPFLSTNNGTTLHTAFSQQVFLNGALDFQILWQFPDTKTVANRFQNAVNVGEPVTWAIYDAGGALLDTNVGTWRFSNGAGPVGARFAGSGSNFSDDDGAWGGGNGVVDGNTGSTNAGLDWGIANRDGGDSYASGISSFIYIRNGASVNLTGATVKSLMYVGDGFAPIPEPTTALFGAALVGVMGLARRRTRSTALVA